MRISREQRRGRAGFTLLEVMIVMTLLGLVMAAVSITMETSRGAVNTSSAVTKAENLCYRALYRIVNEVRDAGKVTLAPALAPPLSSPEINFQNSLGYVAGAPVWGDPLRIQFVPGSGRVTWTENPGLANERSVGLVRSVADYLEGEVPNGLDDNGNGLIDERGLCFTLENNLLIVRLTLVIPGPKNTTVTRTLESQVYCRN